MQRGLALVAAIGLVVVATTACTTTASFNGVRGEGQLVTEQRDVGSFDAIDVGGGIHVRVRIGQPQSVELEGEQNILDILDTVVEDGTLRIDNRDNYSTSRGVTLTIVTPSLTSVSLQGGADGRVEGLDTDALAVDVGGGAVLEASGRAGSVDVTASGGGKALLSGLTAQTVTLDASGGAQVEVNTPGGAKGYEVKKVEWK